VTPAGLDAAGYSTNFCKLGLTPGT